MKVRRNLVLNLFVGILFASTTTLASGNNPDETVIAKLDSIASQYFGEDGAGGVVGVMRSGERFFDAAYGYANIENALMNNAQTVFDIASVSKQFTAFAVLLLEQEGKLQLDDDIRLYLHDLPDYGQHVSVRNLLQHTSGIPSTDVLRLVAGIDFDRTWTQADEMELIRRYPKLNFAPDNEHVYSNAGYSLLAEIVAAVSGMPFGQFLKEKVFQPLGMYQTFVYDSPLERFDHLAKGYRSTPDGFVEVGNLDNMSFGGGNIFSTLDDMLKWGRHFSDPFLCSNSLIERMFTPYNTLENGDTLFYTYGLYVRDYKGVKMIEHSGGVHGFRNQFMLFPDEQLLVTVMSNNESIPSRRLANQLVDVLLEGKLKEDGPKQRVEVQLENEKLHAFEGSFSMPDGMTLSFELDNDTFWLVLPNDARFQLFAERSNSFFLKAFDAQCTFVVGDGKRADEIIWHQGGKDHKGQRLTKKEPLPDGMPESLVGTYLQKELGSIYRIELEEGRLKLILPETFASNLGFGETYLNHINGMQFASDYLGMVTFNIDEKRSETEFILNDLGRLKNINFVKIQ